MTAAVVVLAVICAVLIIYITALRRQMKNIGSELDRTAENGYNRQVRLPLFDSALISLAAAVNRCIDHQKQLKIDTEASEKSLKRAVSDIAHDLRTPLAVIKGDLQLIEKSGGLAGENERHLATCLEKTESLKEMTDEFFELAVLESGGKPVVLSQVNLTSLVMSFLAENEGRIIMSGFEPDIVFPPKTVFVKADPQLLERMLGNLLGNVLKYASGSFRLVLDAGGGGSLCFENSVTDEISEPERLFERSYRADKSRSSGGAGLGLYIVRLLADMQDADVSANVTDGILSVKVSFTEK